MKLIHFIWRVFGPGLFFIKFFGPHLPGGIAKFEAVAESSRMEVELEAVVVVVVVAAVVAVVELWDLFVVVPDYVKSIGKEQNN